MERVMGIEPTSSAWEAEVLPLNHNISDYSDGMMGYQTPNIDRIAAEGVIDQQFASIF